MSLTKDEKEQLKQLLQNDEDAQSKLDSKIEELLAEEDNGIDTASQAHDEAAKQVIADSTSGQVVTDDSTNNGSDAPVESSTPPQDVSMDSGSDSTDATSPVSQPSLGSTDVPAVPPSSAEVSDSTDGLLVATDTAGGIKSVDPTADGAGVVGGGDSSPADLASGFQPVPGQTVEQQLTPPTPDNSVTSSSTPNVASDTNFGHASTNLPGVTDTSDQKEAAASNPEVTHQGQLGSTVAPGAALPGESTSDRNARRDARVASAEQQRQIENGNFSFAGRLNVQDGGGFDVVAAAGTDSEQHLSDLLGVLSNQNVTVTIMKIA